MIITNNEEALRRPCSDASLEEASLVIEQLERELEYSAKMGRPGIGLAAPQCDIQKKVAIVRIDNQYSVNLVNCKIEKAYDKKMFKDEGCLSFPNRVENTMRHQELYITDNLVYPHSFIATGLMAVVIAHELDHINGVLLPDLAIKREEQIKHKIRPNDPCFCGSINPITKQTIKFKRCHGVKK